jgi:hypothetical protein
MKHVEVTGSVHAHRRDEAEAGAGDRERVGNNGHFRHRGQRESKGFGRRHRLGADRYRQGQATERRYELHFTTPEGGDPVFEGAWTRQHFQSPAASELIVT